jgi:hypothetical protein
MTEEQKTKFLANVVKQAQSQGQKVDVKEMMKNPEVVERILETQMVDVVPLLIGTPANDWHQISLYCDDSGSFKDLEINLRASQIAGCCGKALQVMGDVG